MASETGATDVHIDRAAEIMWRSVSESNRDVDWPYPEESQFAMIICHGQDRVRDDSAQWASALVPPDERIIALADLRRIVEKYKMPDAYEQGDLELVERMSALIEGGSR